MVMDRRLVLSLAVAAALLLVIAVAWLFKGRAECSQDSHCAKDLACHNNLCTKVCPGPCGSNTDCQVRDHTPVCTCKSGFIGHPYKHCLPYYKPHGSQCTSDDKCPTDMICSSEKCVDPCPNFCGPNTDCSAKDHRVACSCKPGLVGHPFTGCLEPALKKKTYQLNKNKVTWLEALEACRRHDMQLVAIESLEEQNNLEALIRSNGSEALTWWTSGVSVGKRKFVWVSTGYSVEYTNWREGEPTTHRVLGAQLEIEGCIEMPGMWGYEWNDVVCNRYNAYICEA